MFCRCKNTTKVQSFVRFTFFKRDVIVPDIYVFVISFVWFMSPLIVDIVIEHEDESLEDQVMQKLSFPG